MRLDPAAHVVASFNRALVYMYMGKFDEMSRELDHAGDPDNPLVQTFRALALYYTGQTDAAAESMQKVVDSHPEYAWHKTFPGDVPERPGQARRSSGPTK